MKLSLTEQEIETIHGHLTEIERDPVALPFPEFTASNLRVQAKSGEIVPLHLNAMQRDLEANLTGRDLVVKARQMGLSTLIQARQFRRVAYGSCRAATLAHDYATTHKMRAMHRMFYDYLPEGMKPERDQNNASTITYPARHGMVTLTTAGNPDAGIGTTYNDVHGTEVARWKDAAQVMTGLLQGVPADGTIILESTPYGARGWFYERCMEALDGDSAWTLHFYPWWRDDGYAISLDDDETLDLNEDEMRLVSLYKLTLEQIKWRRAKIKELPHTFRQEYPEDVRSCFLSGGNSAFDDFEHCLTAPLNPEWQEGHRYMAGVDWGQSDDFTTLCIIDATDDVEVFIGRWRRMEWAVMQDKIVHYCGLWHVETIQPEKNSMGTVNIENMYGKYTEAGIDVTVRSITMTNRRKQKLVGNLYNGIHEGGLQLLPKAMPSLGDELYANSELRTFISNQTEGGLYKYEAAAGAHDDTVIARLLAWDACCKMI